MSPTSAQGLRPTKRESQTVSRRVPRTSPRVGWPVAVILVAFLCPRALVAQTVTGKILGVVQDASEAVIPGATVKVTNVGTNISQTTTTSTAGFYEFLNLPPAEYQIEAEFKGFKKFLQRGIILQVNQQARIDITLQPGSVVEVVEVTARPALLETASSTIGQVVNQREIRDLPLNGRDAFQLIALSAGVTPVDGGTTGIVQQATINGGRQGMTEVFLDGAPNTFGDNASGALGVAYTPMLESLQEFKVITNNLSAEFGNAGSGIINLATLSGTNEFHGNLFQFHRNSVLDANNFFNNRAGIDLKSFKRNQFGGSLGGPIRRDKTFFFVDYEGVRERAQDTTSRVVPDLSWRQGNFSNLLTGELTLLDCFGTAYDSGQLFNPFTTREVTCPDGTTTFTRDPFPGNIIPDDLKSASALALLDFWPSPNQAGPVNYFASGSAITTSDQFDGRLDHHLGERQRLMGRYGFSRGYYAPPNYFGNIADPGFFPSPSRAQHALFEHNFSLNPTTLWVTGLSFARNTYKVQAGAPGFDVTQIGQVPSWRDQLTIHQFPLFYFVSVTGLGGGFVGSRQVAERYSLRSTLSRVQGRHSLKFGAQIDMWRTSEGSPAFPAGQYFFAPSFSVGPMPLGFTDPASGELVAPGGGHDFAEFLLGLPSPGVSQDVFRAMQSWYYGFYFQDDIKVSRKLTLNLGIRYDLSIPYTERYNRATWFDFDAPFPVQLPAENIQALVDGAAARGVTLSSRDLERLTNLRGGERFAEGDPDRHAFATDTNNFQPRFGFAYQLTDNWVMRGGAGLFFGFSPTAAQGTSYPFNIDGFGTLQSGLTTLDGATPLCQPAAVDPERRYCLENPIPGGLTPLLGSSKGLLTFFDPVGTIISMARDLPNPTVYNWNYGLQRTLPGNMLLSAHYVGSRALRFPTGTVAIHPLNQLPRSTTEKFRDQLFELVPNPFFGIVQDPASPLAYPEVTLYNLLGPFPQFTADYFPFLTVWPLNGQSTYHSFQLRLEKQFSHGLAFLLSYTNSKLIDNGEGALFGAGLHGGGPQDSYNYRLEKSLAGQDVPQRLIFSYIWELPFGQGRKFAIQNRALNAILGGWQVNGILSLGSGVPIPYYYWAFDPSLAYPFTTSPRMDKICDPVLSGPIADRLDRYFNISCFADPAPYSLGTAPRTDPRLRAPGVRNLDFSAFKDFNITERWRVQFRGEFFNFTNTPRFGSPGFTLNSPDFGIVTGQANAPRQIQLGLKIMF